MARQQTAQTSVPPSGFDPADCAYRAFISYARHDRDVVDDLYRRLIRYRTPRSLRASAGRMGRPPRLLRIYLDRMGGETGGTLPDLIKRKLHDSAFLIVVCSKASLDRYWVNEEIRLFLEHASPGRIIPVYLRETLETPLEDITPPALSALGTDAPLGADLLVDGGIVSVRDKVLGGLLGFAQDQISRAQERADRRANRRRNAALVAITGLLVLSVIAGIAAFNARNAALSSEARILARAASEAAVRDGQPDLGLLLALNALPDPQAEVRLLSRPYEPQAAAALATALFWHGERVIVGTPAADTYRAPHIDVSPDGSVWAFALGRTIKLLSSVGAELVAEATIAAEDGEIRSLRFSPDGARLVVGTSNGLILLFDDETATLALRVDLGTGLIDDARVRPGHRDILIDSRHEPIVLDAQTGTVRFRLEGHTRQVWQTAYSQDGKLILTKSGDRSVRLWDAETGEELARLTTEAHLGFEDVALSADASTAITTTKTHLQRWSLPDAAETHAMRARASSHPFERLALSPDGTVLAVAEDEEISLRDAGDLRLLHMLDGHRGPVAALRFSADGAYLASAASDETVRVWDVAAGMEIGRYIHPERPVEDIIFVDDDTGIVAAGRDEAAYLWSLPPVRPAVSVFGHRNIVRTVDFSADGERLVTASNDNTAKVWDARTGALVHALGGERTHGWSLVGARFSPDGRRVVTFSEAETAALWDAVTGEGLYYWTADGTVLGAAFSPDSSRLALASADGMVAIIDVATGGILFQTAAHQGGAYGVMFAPDGSELLSHGADGQVRTWDALTGEARLGINLDHTGVASALYSPEGTQILAALGGGGLGVAMLLDAGSGEAISRFSSHDGIVRSAAFAPDGRRVVTASADGTAKVWDTLTGLELASVESGQRNLTDVAISPDGSRFVTVAGDSEGPSAILWDLATGQRIADYVGQGTTALDVVFAPNRPGEPMRFATAGYDNTARIWNGPRAVSESTLYAEACEALARTGRRLTPQEVAAYGITAGERSVC